VNYSGGAGGAYKLRPHACLKHWCKGRAVAYWDACGAGTGADRASTGEDYAAVSSTAGRLYALRTNPLNGAFPLDRPPPSGALDRPHSTSRRGRPCQLFRTAGPNETYVEDATRGDRGSRLIQRFCSELADRCATPGMPVFMIHVFAAVRLFPALERAARSSTRTWRPDPCRPATHSPWPVGSPQSVRVNRERQPLLCVHGLCPRAGLVSNRLGGETVCVNPGIGCGNNGIRARAPCSTSPMAGRFSSAPSRAETGHGRILALEVQPALRSEDIVAERSVVGCARRRRSGVVLRPDGGSRPSTASRPNSAGPRARVAATSHKNRHRQGTETDSFTDLLTAPAATKQPGSFILP